MNVNKTLSKEDFQGRSLFITTPAFGCQVCSDWALSIATTTRVLGALGVDHDLFIIGNDSLISRARNVCVANFMASNFTHMIFIDADTGFDYSDVLKFLIMDEDVLCGGVPMKRYPIMYNTTLVKDDAGKFLKHKDFFYKVEYVGTAFMMIKREVIQKMFNHYKDLKYEIESRDDEIRKRLSVEPPPHAFPESKYGSVTDLLYTLFDVQSRVDDRDPESGTKRYYGEDQTFCRRWREMGGEILLDASVKLDHIGTHKFEGNPSEIEHGPSIKSNQYVI